MKSRLLVLAFAGAAVATVGWLLSTQAGGADPVGRGADVASNDDTQPADSTDAAARAGRMLTELTETGLLVGLAGIPHGPVLPVPGMSPAELRDSFGAPRDDDRRHIGIDIGAAQGTPVAAVVDGWIVALSNGAAGGIGLHLLDRTRTYLLYYGHLDGYAEPMFAGRAVRRGEPLGYVGATGNADGWPHLHFEVGRIVTPGRYAVRPLNPYEYLTGRN